MQVADQRLVEQCRAGDRDAFTELVGRYQSLVCAVAYGATGNLAVSEELAQEAFIAAWQSISQLREPARLRQWLCGIVRNLANSDTRRRSRDVLHRASAIEQIDHADTSAVDPMESSMAEEEYHLLDQTLESLPASYREPLVLFYREEQSVAKVAELLDLSPDAVKQRLTRGRHMLRDEVAALVERGLRQSAPGRAFTIGVLAALPVMSGSATAATLTATGANGVGAMKAAGSVGMSGAILGPLVGILGGWFGYSMSLKSARSSRERTFIKRMTLAVLGLIAVFGVILTLLILNVEATKPHRLAIAIVAAGLGYGLVLLSLILVSNRTIVRIRRETGTLDRIPVEVAAGMPAMIHAPPSRRFYDSKTRLCGIPLVAVRFNGTLGLGDNRPCEPAVGWIAIGDKAYGILFASGNLAVGAVAIGALSFGLVSLGGFAVGALAIGGLTVGIGSLGGLAVGWLALGGGAAAWKAAKGGVAVAHQYALGGVAFGEEVNSEVAKALIETHPFFDLGQTFMTPWVLWPALVMGMIPALIAMRCIPSQETQQTTAAEASAESAVRADSEVRAD